MTIKKATHTPGPWRVVNRNNQTGYKSVLVVAGPANSQIARFDYHGDLEYPIANARLIAAAPDMLQALLACHERIETLLDADEATDNDIEVLGMVSIAIAKARGEQI